MEKERSQDAFISVMPDTEQGVELLRQRLALVWGAIALLCTIGVAATHGLRLLLLVGGGEGQLSDSALWAQLGALPLVGAVWFLCRFTRPSRGMLALLDAAAVVAFCGGGALQTYVAPSTGPSALEVSGPLTPSLSPGLLAVVVIPTLRAALVPSTPRATAIVSLLGAAPMISVALLLRAQHPSPGASAALGLTLLVSALFIPLPTIISAAIYRLQRQVDEAMQLGQYTLEAKIGEGGMGLVYRARHALLRRPTAIKLLPPERAGAEALARFKREVEQTSRLSHPNTISIYDFGTTGRGLFYYAMEYLDGVSLQELVDHDGPQPPGRVAHLLVQACGALAEAHAAGLVHRDIKPANVHVSNRGGVADHVKVLDFGLVKDIAATGARAEASLTSAGRFLGTPLYIAPEAITDSGPLDARADLYALGAVAYFMLTGSAPFRGATLVEVCSQHLHVQPEPPSSRLGRSVPAALEALVLRCLAKSPGERPPSARELARSLASAVADCPWTVADAEQWWTERAPAVLERCAGERAKDSTGGGPTTVAVDLAR